MSSITVTELTVDLLVLKCGQVKPPQQGKEASIRIRYFGHCRARKTSERVEEDAIADNKEDLPMLS